jgi:ribosomal-protein-alanine N-acetyltransferase
MESIITDRCVLYPLAQSDFDELIPLFASEEVRRYLGGVHPVDDSLANLRNSIRAANEYPFAVRLKDTQECIGYLSIAPHHSPVDMEISYMFSPEYWGNGYARETVKATLAFCKQKLNLSRVVSETQTANIRSCRLLEKLGYHAGSHIERFGAKQTVYVYEFGGVEH